MRWHTVAMISEGQMLNRLGKSDTPWINCIRTVYVRFEVARLGWALSSTF